MKISNIGKIKNNKDLSRFSINKPIHLNNYIWHYLALYGNLTGFKLLKNKDILFGLPDQDGNNPLHLSSKMGHYDMLKYLIDNYPEYILNRNNEDKNFLHYLTEKETVFIKFFNLLLKNEKINELMKQKNDDDLSVTMLSFSNYSKKSIINIIDNKPDILNYPKLYPSLFFIFKNSKLSNFDVLDIFKLIKKKKLI